MIELVELRARVADVEQALAQTRAWADAEQRRADLAERALREALTKVAGWPAR
jgi:hypothetical protein